MPISPYGGILIDRVVTGNEADLARARARGLPQIRISDFTLSDLYLIAVGAYSPLTGFMAETEYRSVLEHMRLERGLPWSIPVTLPVARAIGVRLGPGDSVALLAPDHEPAAILHVTQVYGWDREEEAKRVYGTTDRNHPGVARLDSMGEMLVAGPIEYLYAREITAFPGQARTPAAVREEATRRGWQSLAAFQTRNPLHRAHEYLQKCALEMVDGLLLHPLVGDTKADDVPADVRMESYRVLLDTYYPTDRVILSALPAAMRYAGPREAIFHAIIRRNYGCTHFIVGRDHAGVGSYYGSYDAQLIFGRIDLQALGIQPLLFEHAFFCRTCGQMVTAKTCPHAREHHVFLSGTQVRELLARGERPPPEFTRPEVADLLVRAYAAAAAA